MTFTDRLNGAISSTNSLLCIGLDPVLEKIPQRFQKSTTPLLDFCRYIVDETASYAVAFKPNSAFFEAEGARGIEELQQTIEYIKKTYPETLVILDAKRADIGSTNEAYVRFAFDYLHADAITLHPYLGKEGIQPFLNRSDKGCIILCHTSNPGAGEIQEMYIHRASEGGVAKSSGSRTMPIGRQVGVREDKIMVYEYIAEQIAHTWNANKNCMLVVGATYPEQLRRVRELVGDLPILVPGIGAQGGDLEATLQAGLTEDKKGLIITVSRAVIYAEDPKEEAERLRAKMNAYR